LFPIKTELEDLSFKYEHPELYAEIEQKLAQVKEVQAGYFEEFAAPIHRKLTMMGYEYKMYSRNKSVYSVYKKMTKKGVPFEQIYDLLAARIVFEPQSSLSEKDQCWMIYSALTEIYRPHPERIRDWISMPKANGYEALHVTVMSQHGQWIEVQIRTNRMHELAEHGLAAHWRYKTGEGSGGGLDKWLKEIKDVLANPDPDAIAFLDTFTLNLFAHEVFVFTPKGDIRTLAQGATVLDLAYQLHSELGEHCIGANVNRMARPLSYILQSGDQVEVLTSKKQQPEPEWLEIAVTAKAKDSIKKYFRKSQGIFSILQKEKDTKAKTAKISITGEDSFGVLMRIMNIICDHKANMRDLHVTTEGKMFHCDVELVIFKQKVVSQMCMKLRSIESVTAVNVVGME
jgi:GTP pyrophosphokinase